MKRVCVVVLMLAGCTDASRSKMTALGAADVTCYSGGQVVYSGKSSGRVQAEEQSDGWYFQEADSGAFIRVSGTCIIRNP